LDSHTTTFPLPLNFLRYKSQVPHSVTFCEGDVEGIGVEQWGLGFGLWEDDGIIGNIGNHLGY
jgi:hypothetical protein